MKCVLVIKGEIELCLIFYGLKCYGTRRLSQIYDRQSARTLPELSDRDPNLIMCVSRVIEILDLRKIHRPGNMSPTRRVNKDLHDLMHRYKTDIVDFAFVAIRSRRIVATNKIFLSRSD